MIRGTSHGQKHHYLYYQHLRLLRHGKAVPRHAKNHKYDIVNLDEQPERQAEALGLSGALTVPVTVVTKHDDSREVVVGYNLAKLAPALV